MLPSTASIARATRATREEFASVYREAQAEAGVHGQPLLEFEAVSHSTVLVDAFKEALDRAAIDGWLAEVFSLLVRDRLEDGSLGRVMATMAVAQGDATLQAMVNELQNFGQPDVMSRGFLNGMKWTTKVMIDGSAAGTGVLVQSNMVLTAWHVVKSLFTKDDATQKYAPDRSAADRLRLQFDDSLRASAAGNLLPQSPVVVEVNAEWCPAYSPCSPNELNEGVPAQGEDGFWDYAFLRLSSVPGAERRWATLAANDIPGETDNVIVFQHPTGQPLRLALGTIAAADAVAAYCVPATRFLHSANALNGSSGSPVFDKTFKLVGVHQGTWKRAGVAATAVNRGVPLKKILGDLEAQKIVLPPPDLSEQLVSSLKIGNLPAPVVDCDEFQKLVWDSASDTSIRLITINGPDSCGKSFRLALLNAILPASEHLQITLNSTAIANLPAEQLAAMICDKAGAAVPTFVSAQEYQSTKAAWVRGELVGETIVALNNARNGRLVWLRFEDLNKADIRGEDASDFLTSLYQRVATEEWLRIVLDGMRSEVPIELENIAVRHKAEFPIASGIETYFRRAITSGQGPGIPNLNDFTVAAGLIFDDLQADLTSDPRAAINRFVQQIRRVMIRIKRGGQ